MANMPTIYIKNMDLLDSIDNIAEQVNMSRSSLVCKLLTVTVNNLSTVIPEETATGLRYHVDEYKIDFDGK